MRKTGSSRRQRCRKMHLWQHHFCRTGGKNDARSLPENIFRSAPRGCALFCAAAYALASIVSIWLQI